MTSAQDEFHSLINNNSSSQLSDRNSSPTSSRSSSPGPTSEPAMPSRTPAATSTSNYHIPNTVYDANTGPKGVIADAQAFERARKSSFRKTLLSAAGFSSHNDAAAPQYAPSQGVGRPLRDGNNNNISHNKNNGSASDDDEENFIRKWRASRMQELQTHQTGSQGRRVSPRRRMFGYVEDVDAGGYLDAIEKVPADVVVVVCIYDPESNPSAIVEDALPAIARKNPQTHFVKLHHEIAQMDHIEAPALLAYRGAEVFATLVDIFRLIPRGKNVTPESLEDLLKMNRVL